MLRLCEAARSDAANAREAAGAIADILRQKTQGLADAVAGFRPVSLVFASGTARAIASLPLLESYERAPAPRRCDSTQGLLSPIKVSRTALRGLGSALIGLDADALSGLGVPADRHATVGPGAIVMQTLMELIGFEEATVATRALREGVIVRALQATREQRVIASAEGAPLF